MLGICYFIVSVVTLIITYFTPVPLCWTESCKAIPGILGWSWFNWGALFYVISGALCLVFPKKSIIGAFLTAGAVFHIGLIMYEYALTSTICPVCWKFAVVDTVLATLYWVLPNKGVKPLNVVFSVLGATLISVVMYSALTDLQAQPYSSQLIAQAQEQPLEQSQETAPELVDTENYLLQVSTSDGQNASIGLQDKPALFFAVWCTHCDQTLQVAATLEPEKRPYLVATYLTMEDGEKIADKLAAAGLSGEPYYTVPEPPFGIKGVPSLVYGEGKYFDGMKAILEKLKKGER